MPRLGRGQLARRATSVAGGHQRVSPSTPMAGGSSAGASAQHPMRVSVRTHANRPSTTAVPSKEGGRVHHRDRPSHGLLASRCRATGGRYLSIKQAERLAEARIASVGSVGDSDDTALAQTIHRRNPRRSFKEVEYPTREWVNWFGTRRSSIPSGTSRPRTRKPTATLLWKRKPGPRNRDQSASGKPGAAQLFSSDRAERFRRRALEAA